MNKQDFITRFNEVIESDYSEIWVGISMPDLPETEYICNPRENFDAKLLYYVKAYDENLKLKTYNAIEIIDIFGTI